MTRKAWLLLIGLGVLWGIPYLLIRIAVTDFHPIIVAFWRATLGAMILLPFALRGNGMASGFSKPLWLAAYTVAEISGPWLLIGYAELHVTSSLAGLIIALTPAIATVVGIVFFDERFVKQRIFGLCLGFSGVVTLLGFDDKPPQTLPVLALCLSALGYAIGPIIVARKLSDVDATATVVASLIVASAIYAPFVPMHWPAGFSLSATAAVVALALFCTAMAFQMLFALVSEVGPARATVVTYINPAVAALLGVVVLNEPFSAALCLGFVLILAGSYFSTWGQSQSRRSSDFSNTQEQHMPALKRLQWSVDIAAPASRVYEMLVGPGSYKQWTSAFGEGLSFEGSWQTGQPIRFLTPEGHGVISEIAENRPNEFLSVRHLGYIANGVEDTSSEAIRAWAPAYENYTFAATPQGTKLIVDQDMTEEFASMVELWPKALAKLKTLCES